MSAHKQKLYAFEQSIKIIEGFAQSGTFNVTDNSLQALNNTYEKMKELFPISDELGVNDFLVQQT
ncbi:MAG: hypothetical protein QTN59_00990 [Candidatus Electrothrix communis]|nr:MAG: hypothetical protein QTN59_00990 [Candidatus Electrothrix communis]